MFISLPEFEITDPNVSTPSASRFWRGFGFIGVKPWLIATLHSNANGEFQIDTLCLWIESDLAPLLYIDESHGRLVGLQRVAPADQGEMRGWQLNDVEEVWISKARNADDPDTLMYRFEDAGDRLESLDGGAPPAHRPLRLLKSFVGG